MKDKPTDNESHTEHKSEAPAPVSKSRAPLSGRPKAFEIRDAAVYNVSEVATILQVTDNTVRAILKRGEMQARKIGQEWRILGESLKAYMKASSIFKDNAADQ
jgi:excisionase family DNA binding protein